MKQKKQNKPKTFINEAQILIKTAVNHLCDYAVKTGDQTHLINIQKLGDVLKALHNYKAHPSLPTPPKIKIKPKVFFGYNTISK
jgi:hypothetical protein